MKATKPPDAQSSSAPPSTLGSALRQARRLPWAEVADATGVSVSFPSLVENGRSDITIGRLTRAGDSAYCAGDTPHLFRNASDRKRVRVICIDSPPPL